MRGRTEEPARRRLRGVTRKAVAKNLHGWGQTPPPPKRRTPMPRRIGRCRRLQDRFSLLRVPSLRATSSLPRRPWAFIGLVGSLGTSLFSSRVLRPRRPRFPTTPPAFGGIRRYCCCGTPCPFFFAPMGAPSHPACALLVSNWTSVGVEDCLIDSDILANGSRFLGRRMIGVGSWWRTVLADHRPRCRLLTLIIWVLPHTMRVFRSPQYRSRSRRL